MKKVVIALVVVLVTGMSFVAGVSWSRRHGAASIQADALYYTCPMHPQYRSDRPGDCPSCGMRLEPVRATRSGASEPAGGRPGTVHVTIERQQATGVRLGVAERISGARLLRTTGRVAPNENATYPIVAGVSGWVRDVKTATTGTQVKKNEILASVFAPEFVNAQQAYFSALETVGRVNSGQMPTYSTGRVVEGVRRYADALRNLGVSEKQLADMAERRELVQDIFIMSPIDGFVLQRGVSKGLRFDRGFEFYRIADLTRVWILADVYQHQLPYIKRGASVRVTAGQENRPLAAIVSAAEPVFDEATLTLRLRLEAPNPGYVLKPGMFVDVELPIELPPTLAVPADAIVDSGVRKTVFVDLGDGYFEPRQVETGWRIGDRIEVTKGLMEGEHIVISGTFLIDSESRMKASAQGVAGASSEDPVCGMQVDEMRASAAGRAVQHGGKAYFFCSETCKHDFVTDPSRYVAREKPPVPGRSAGSAHADPADPRTDVKPGGDTAGAETATDPICGMSVEVPEAVAAHLTSRHGDATYYFCSETCKKKFDAEPAKFAKGASQ